VSHLLKDILNILNIEFSIFISNKMNFEISENKRVLDPISEEDLILVKNAVENMTFETSKMANDALKKYKKEDVFKTLDEMNSKIVNHLTINLRTNIEDEHLYLFQLIDEIMFEPEEFISDEDINAIKDDLNDMKMLYPNFSEDIDFLLYEVDNYFFNTFENI
jgi:hypothetical protein